MCLLGMTRACTGATGRMSLNATTWSFSKTIRAAVVRATMLQQRHLAMAAQAYRQDGFLTMRAAGGPARYAASSHVRPNGTHGQCGRPARGALLGRAAHPRSALQRAPVASGRRPSPVEWFDRTQN